MHRMCFFKCAVCLNDVKQISHSYGFSPPMYTLVCLYHPPKTQFSWAIGFFIFYLQRILRKVGGRLLPPLVELFLLGCLKTFERDGPRLRPWPRDNRRVGVCVFGFLSHLIDFNAFTSPPYWRGNVCVFLFSDFFISRDSCTRRSRPPASPLLRVNFNI